MINLLRTASAAVVSNFCKFAQKQTTMGKITLQYDADDPIAEKTLEFLISIGIFKKVESRNPDENSKEKAYLDNLKKIAPSVKKQALSKNKNKSLQSLIDEL